MFRTLIGQTMLLSASHFFVRVIGFSMRIWLSRKLGPQAMGLVELAQSAQMLLITPVVSGLPAAISRMCAKAEHGEGARILRCGLFLALCISIPLSIAAFFLRVPLSLWLGDLRTLPALIVYLPCIPILAASCALNGYYYGIGKPVPPALSEILEQLVRFFLCVRLVSLLQSWPMTLRAAIPAAATLAGETASLLLMIALSMGTLWSRPAAGARQKIYREMISLALPLTGMKLVTSFMRTAQSAVIPARLQATGIPSGEALSLFGMISGMLMPILLLPSFVTCSLSMVAAPELARRQAQRKPHGRLTVRVLAAALAIGLLAMGAVFAFAPLISHTLYRQAELLTLLRRSCLLIPVMALCQVSSGLMNGLGLQGKSLRISLAAGFLSVLLAYALCGLPAVGIWGAVIAIGAGQLLTLVLNLFVLRHGISLDPAYERR
ncbi:MAG: oligosaccharide flippase family protein [Clostridia bacterium]|nr:oligosaccharide flippase family protein [Clostridia bacterium]MBQ7053467.1 oligosaccharide flippase family protein [Clostridia bacterium]